MKLIIIPGSNIAIRLHTVARVSLRSNLPKTEHFLKIVLTNGEMNEYTLPTVVQSTAEQIFTHFIQEFNSLTA